MDIEEFRKHFYDLGDELNSHGIPDCEGYSLYEMSTIVHNPFSLNSRIDFQKLGDDEFANIPMFNQIRFLTDLIAKNGELKLTDKGFLPTKVVSELYGQGFIKDDLIESGISKLYKEGDCMSINLTRILLELSGLVKKRNGKLSLTKSKQQILFDNNDLLRYIFLTFASKFNWAYYDGYVENGIGQYGYGFSLILLSKYGDEKRLDSFYSEKYFKAFPHLLIPIKPDYGTVERYTSRCYSVRTFERFLDYFGLIIIDKENKWLDTNKYITKTDLFDKLFKCLPHYGND
jgi:hypothetical protein